MMVVLPAIMWNRYGFGAGPSGFHGDLGTDLEE